MRETISKTSMIRRKNKLQIKDFILNHIYENLKGYLLVTVIFFIGIVIGVIFINHVTESQYIEIQEYVQNFVTALKGDYHIDTMNLLKNSLADNLKLIIGMWFIGSTVIGIPIVLGIVLFRGFCIGYTVSAVISILGIQKGMLFFATSILLQNLIFIPVIIVLAVSGIKVYKSIMKDKRRENIKIEIVRHTIYCIILLLFLVVASFIESYISANLLTACIQFL